MTVITVLAYDGVGEDISTFDFFRTDSTFISVSSTRVVYQTFTGLFLDIIGTFVSTGPTAEATEGPITRFELWNSARTVLIATITDVSLNLSGFLAEIGGASQNESQFDESLFSGSDTLIGAGGLERFNLEGGDDSATGSASADTVGGGGGSDSLDGGAAADSLDGAEDNDSLMGGDGNDTVSGVSGEDTLVGGAGGDLMIGGDGTDVADYSASTVALIIDEMITLPGGGPSMDGAGLGDTLDTIERIIATAFADNITLAVAAYVIEARGGNDVVMGGIGDDTILSAGLASDLDVLSGGGGNDSLSADGSAVAILSGNENADTLAGGSGFAWLDGGEGGDSLVAGSGVTVVSYLTSTQGLRFDLTTPANMTGQALGDSIAPGINVFVTSIYNDTVVGGSTMETLHLFGGNDTLLSGGGNDLGFGYEGDDTLDGGAGNDFMGGGDGNDSLIGSSGDDGLIGEGGNDTIDAGVGNDVVQSGDGADSIGGSDGNDILIGNVGSDTIFGGLGNDVLVGGQFSGSGAADVDQLFGEQGDDIFMIGTFGRASMEGGLGVDLFYGGDGADTIFGGAGNDQMYGFGGADSYQIRPEDVIGGEIDFIGFLETIDQVKIPRTFAASLTGFESGGNTIFNFTALGGGIYSIYFAGTSIPTAFNALSYY